MAEKIYNVTVNIPAKDGGYIERKFEQCGPPGFTPDGSFILHSALGAPLFMTRITEGVMIDFEQPQVLLAQPVVKM
jgi:hypothetical protein